MRNIVRQAFLPNHASILIIATLSATFSFALLTKDYFTHYTEQVGLTGSQLNRLIMDKFRNHRAGIYEHLISAKHNNESKINPEYFSGRN